MPKSTWIWSSN